MNNKNLSNNEIEEAVFEEPMILININKLYEPNMGEEALYDATRSSWKIDTEHANNIKYVCAVYQGLVKEVYIADRWIKETEGERSYFEGKLASDLLREKYIGKSVKSYWPKGSQGPIKYSCYWVNGIRYKS